MDSQGKKPYEQAMDRVLYDPKEGKAPQVLEARDHGDPPAQQQMSQQQLQQMQQQQAHRAYLAEQPDEPLTISRRLTVVKPGPADD